MKISQAKIEELIIPIIEGMGFYVWHIDLHQSKRNSLLRIYVDVPVSDERKSVTADECSEISNQVGALLDVEEVIPGSYTLEVSSPGLNRSLFNIEQYKKYLGEMVNISLFKPQDEKRRDYKGKIEEVSEDTLKLLVDDQVVTFDLTNICKTKLISCF